jgi:hypothetical protein
MVSSLNICWCRGESKPGFAGARAEIETTRLEAAAGIIMGLCALIASALVCDTLGNFCVMAKPESEWLKLKGKGSWIVYTILFAAVTFMWWPTLFEGKAIIFGDSVIHGLPLLQLFRNFLHGGESPLWVKEIYGGHALFAEGQGGFASPLNLLVALVFPPVLASSVFHYLGMLVAGVGVARLCRILGSTRWSAGFAAFAVIFSGSWISTQNNLTIAGALVWVPWTLVVFESWLKRPSVTLAICMAFVGTLSVVSGYPQATHGVLIFALCTLATMPFSDAGKQHWQQHWRTFLGTGFLALLFCLGLSAIQLMPLVELIGLSHRGNGVGIVFQALKAYYVRGMLFPLAIPNQVPGVSNLLVCMLASALFVMRSQWRVAGYLVGSVILLVLGMGGTSPLFRLIYGAHLVPGLHYFRIFWIYISIAVVGIAVMAAFAIDGLKKWFSEHGDPLKWKSLNWLIGLLFLGAWIVVAIALSSSLALAVNHRAHWIPAAMFVLIALQCACFATHGLKFYDAGILHPPSVLNQLPRRNTEEGGKFFSESIAMSYAFLDSKTPGLERLAQRAVALDAGMTNLLRGDSSLDGALALQLYGRDILSQTMIGEVHGIGEASPGLRVIDFLNVRYITADAELYAPGLRVAAHDPLGFWVMENTFARPFAQVYKDAVQASSSNDALARMRVLKSPTLIVQRDPDGALMPENAPGQSDAAAVKISTVENRPNHYIIEVQAPFPCWVFLADANYPGWRATVDGAKTTVWTAQVLGKAIHVPAGKHQMVVRFRSESFRLGATISATTLLIMLAVLNASWIEKRQTRYCADV